MIITLSAAMTIPRVLCSASTRPIRVHSDEPITYAQWRARMWFRSWI